MARVALNQIKAMPPWMDRAKMDPTTEVVIERYMREDGEAPDAPLGTFRTVWPAAVVPARVGMSQTEFARALHIPVATLRDWEQGRARPDPACRSLLRITAENPQAAFAPLAPSECGWFGWADAESAGVGPWVALRCTYDCWCSPGIWTGFFGCGWGEEG